MGMVLYLRRVEDPAALWELVADPEAFFEYLFEADDADENIVDFDKAWQALHFLLTGSAWEGTGPLTFLLHAGEEIGEDQGYGPTRLASPDEVRAFRDAFAAIDDAELRRRYDPTAMVAEEVYIADGLVDEGEDGWKYVTQSLPALRQLLDRSVETNASIAILIS